MGIKVLSLFDGISCGMVALEREGFKIDKYIAYEKDPEPIKISRFNYPQIEQYGDVFEAVYAENEFDLLIGGSPCTYWSVAQNPINRETTSSGFGWELFMQYVRALKESKPKYFLYENNYSISKQIKEEITKQLGVDPIYINSNLVSGQNRPRLYWTNIPEVTIPSDRKIKMNDVVDFSKNVFRPVGNWVFGKRGESSRFERLSTINQLKSNCLTTSKTHNEQYYANEEKTEYTNLTVNQYELLQTLPLNYVDAVDIKETSKYRAIGNGWTVDVIAHIFSFMDFKEDGDEESI